MFAASRRQLTLAMTVCALFCTLLPTPASALKIMSWNTLNYPGNTGPTRSPSFQAVIDEVDPDVMVCQEIQGLAGATAFRDNVLNVVNPGQWTLAVFSDGPDSDNALYVRSNVFTTAAASWLNTSPRQIDWWQLRPAGNLTSGGDLVVYSGHFKASDTSEDAEIRRQTARAIRDHMIANWSEGQHILVMGDFNLYRSTEPAWGALTGNPIEPAQLFDPIDSAGSWNNNAAFASVHTQSTRTTSIGDGGATGGGDDRFDFILVDADLLDTESWDFIPGSYTAFGQDGLHFNLAINAPPLNAAVGQTLADHLHNASDHLPVVIELQTPARAQLLPASVAFGSVLQGSVVAAKVLQLRNASIAGADELDFAASTSAPLSVGGTTSGELQPAQVAAIQVILDTSTVGLIAPNVIVSTDDPVATEIEAPVTGRVVRASRPSLASASDLLTTTVNAVTPNDASGEIVLEVFNVGHDADQAAVYVSGASFSGADASRFSLLDPAAFFVLGTAIERRVGVDASGVPDGTILQATLTLTAQDDFVVVGGQSRGPLVVDFEVEVDDGITAAPTVISRTTLHAPVPTPFNPRTTLSFDLAQTGHARLEVFDIRGRRVTTLVDAVLGAGQHSRVWEATDASGAPLASGVYLVRFVGPDTVEVRRAVLVR